MFPVLLALCINSCSHRCFYLQGIQYFTCPPKRGLFVRVKSIKRLSSGPTRRKSFYELADKKQKSSSSSLSTHEEQQLFRYWNSIDRHEEKEALRCSQQIGSLNKEITKQYELEGEMVDLLDTSISVSRSLAEKDFYIPAIDAAGEAISRRKSLGKDAVRKKHCEKAL